MNPSAEMEYLANVLVVELADLGFTMSYSFARRTLEEHLDELVELSGLKRDEVIGDHLTDEGVAVLAVTLAGAFREFEEVTNIRLPGVVLGAEACLQVMETLGRGVNELTGMDRTDGVAVAGEMIALLAGASQKSATVHLSGAGCARLATALDCIVQATDPRHTARDGAAHGEAVAALYVLVSAVEHSETFGETAILTDVRWLAG